jgi:hypothetical protein
VSFREDTGALWEIQADSWGIREDLVEVHGDPGRWRELQEDTRRSRGGTERFGGYTRDPEEVYGDLGRYKKIWHKTSRVDTGDLWRIQVSSWDIEEVLEDVRGDIGR